MYFAFQALSAQIVRLPSLERGKLAGRKPYFHLNFIINY